MTIGGGTGQELPDPDEVREGAEAAVEVAEALADLAEHVEDRFQPPLERLAEPHLALAELYAEVDYDLARLDVDDDEQMARLSEAGMAVLFGPDLDAEEQAAFDELVTTLVEECPHLDLDVGSDVATQGEASATDVTVLLEGHTVTLSDDAAARVLDTVENTRDALAREFGELDFPEQEPCPLWRPEDVVARLGDLLDADIEVIDTVQERQGGSDWWMFTCGSRDRREGAAEWASRGPLEIWAMPAEDATGRLEAGRRRQAGGHPIFEREATGSEESVYEAFAVDLDHDLLLAVRAETPELARETLVVVLDGLGAG